MNSIEFIAFRGDEYPLIRERCRQLCEWAEAVRCPAVILVPSATPSLETTWDQIVDEYVRVLRDLSSVAEPCGVNLAFEFLGFGWCSVRTPRGAFEIVQAVDRENIGIVFDAAHFYGGGGLISEIAAVDPQKILTVHLDDVEDSPKEGISIWRRVLPGTGVVPLGEICAQLSAIGYDGWCSIELFRPEYWEWPADELAARAREAAINVLSPFFQLT